MARMRPAFLHTIARSFPRLRIQGVPEASRRRIYGETMAVILGITPKPSR